MLQRCRRETVLEALSDEEANLATSYLDEKVTDCSWIYGSNTCS
jgi:hypothetical protein